MTTLEKESLFIAALRRLELRHGFHRVDMSFGEAVSLIAQVQLALRHSQNKGNSAKAARSIILKMIENMGKEEPELEAILREGFTPESRGIIPG